MSVGVLAVLFSPEPVRLPQPRARNAAEWLQGVLIEPFADFFRRYGWQAAQILALIAVYRISDVVMGIMANPFYVDMGFTKDEVATVSKIYGVVMTLVGAFVGGVLSMRLGVMRVLMLGAVLSAASNLLFAGLAIARPRRERAGAGGVGRQPGGRHRVGGLHRLPVEPDQRQLFGHAVRPLQFADAAAAQVHRRLFGGVRGCLWLPRRSSSAPRCWALPVLVLVALVARAGSLADGIARARRRRRQRRLRPCATPTKPAR